MKTDILSILNKLETFAMTLICIKIYIYIYRKGPRTDS